MDQDKVNPFVGNTEAPVGGSPISVPPTPVNPYAPAGAPYAPGSNTPAPDYATPYNPSSDNPAVPNTSAPAAYTSISPAPSVSPEPEKPKLFTKKFIIFAVIGLVLIAGTVVAGIIVQNSRKNSTTSSPKNPTDKFYSYMNYLISGTDSVKKVDSSSKPGIVYYVATELGSTKKYNPEVANTIASKWNDFYDSLSSTSKEGDTMKDYQNLVTLFSIYGKNEPLSTETLLNIFTKESEPEEYIRKYYSPYTDSSSTYAKKYGDTSVEYGLTTYGAYKVYSKYGCINSGTLDKSCLDIQTLEESEIGDVSKFYRNANVEDKLLSQDTNELTEKAWNILYMVEGGERL